MHHDCAQPLVNPADCKAQSLYRKEFGKKHRTILNTIENLIVDAAHGRQYLEHRETSSVVLLEPTKQNQALENCTPHP